MSAALDRIATCFWLALASLVLALGVVLFCIAWVLILAEEACVDLAARLTPRPKPAPISKQSGNYRDWGHG